ncbi:MULTISPECIES: PTS sugar transporter subunit IIA [Geobacillus]|jgi:mannitol PTS system EIIA component|uniref:Mannitol-specific phosphotransferase enzyme IIA component n=3 Tax=Geobacillus thermodenitrificans TaxID=33940 RepID=A4IPF1_GEOTN|nr:MULTISPECIES: PTS sugar transporter subunit IIA [Geobacillus]ABO67205.1 Mannitol enzyme IIA (PTS system) [Geobacillus thermodenitrificans NG80-2]ARA99568.1 PTS mannitol transporter subunit IIA [Geobacillus thermodenitrificans]ARP43000.1 Mannitol-specific phosphotransferase enzyme IIA component [Geobacillus thermodenitrificans]ATO35767.1 PTS mannitol transporter subunit IIA [Geobacillus thermodenitrificans]KQB93140.1 Mannitol-specific phosphotransferase enzyme IIA component [Geobacillus sp. 
MLAYSILKKENIVLNAQPKTKEEAIRLAGEVLVKQGYVDPSYIDAMLEREQLTTTYIGNNVAIPHGTEEAKSLVKQSGISIVQVPGGVDFGGGNQATIVIGIAGKDGEHLDILSKLALVCAEADNVAAMANAKTAEEILTLLNEVNG